MRGRVAAVSTLFIWPPTSSASSAAALAARFLGPMGARCSAAVGALIVTGVWARLFPALRKADRLE